MIQLLLQAMPITAPAMGVETLTFTALFTSSLGFVYFIVRYLMGVIDRKDASHKELGDKKDERIEQMTEMFISSVEKQTAAIVEFRSQLAEMEHTHARVADALNELKGAMRREPRDPNAQRQGQQPGHVA